MTARQRNHGVNCVAKGGRWGAALCLSLVFIVALSGATEARRRHHRAAYAPPYAAMAVDLYTGRILYSKNANAPRYPASLTKVMTLYLLFDALREGKLTMDTPMRVSAHAASQAPSNLDLSAGDTIKVSDAIGALVTKSANDVAVVVAETLAGSEEEFARRMTQKARTLGMLNTTFRNASGLPNPEQRTTAQDLIILAKNILADHPERCKTFSLKYFEYDGETYRNHNSLLFSYQGMEGMKTGFTTASGFNLIATARRGDKRVLAVVLGGPSSRSRNAAMRNLLDASWSKATTYYAARKAGILVAQVKPHHEPVPAQIAAANPSQAGAAGKIQPVKPVALIKAPHTSHAPARSAAGRAEDGASLHRLVRPSEQFLSFARARPRGASAALLLLAIEHDRESQRVAVLRAYERYVAGRAHKVGKDRAKPAVPADMTTDEPEDGDSTGEEQNFSAEAVNVSVHYKTSLTRTDGTPDVIRVAAASGRGELADPSNPAVTTAIATITAPKQDESEAPATLSAAAAEVSKTLHQPGPYHIQVGAFKNAADAEERLDDASEVLGSKAAKAHPKFTVTVSADNGGTIFRARFAKFEERAARAACKKLKRHDIECAVYKAD